MEYARELRPHDAQSMLQVREQVDKTRLMVNLKGSTEVQYIPLKHCYNINEIFDRIAHEFHIDLGDIELIHIMLSLDFGHEVEFGERHVIAAKDDGAFKAFIGMIEKSWRKGKGQARTLLFGCKVFLRVD